MGGGVRKRKREKEGEGRGKERCVGRKRVQVRGAVRREAELRLG